VRTTSEWPTLSWPLTPHVVATEHPDVREYIQKQQRPSESEVSVTDDGPLVMSVEDAAKKLGISRSLAYELVQQGRVPAIRLGRRIVVPRRKLLRFVEGEE
jgi:excisionase family DNA binding protein